jgi:WD40 repeat protein
MITFGNENLIELIFSSCTLYELQTQYQKLKNKILNQITLKLLSYDKIFNSMGRSKVTFAKVDRENLPPVILPNGVLLSASRYKTIRFWNTITGVCLKTLIAEDGISTLAVLPNGDIMAYLINYCKFQVWNNYGEGSTRVIEVIDYYHFDKVLFLKNGDIACIHEDCMNLIILYSQYNYQTSKILDTLEDSFFIYEQINHISDNLFYSLSSESLNTVKIYDINNDYRCVHKIKQGFIPKILSNNMLFVTNVNIKILDIYNKYECLHCLEGHTSTVTALLFIERNQLLISGSSYIIKVWAGNNNYNCVRTIHTGDIWFGKFLFLKNRYFAMVFNNKIRIWDSVGLKCIRTLRCDIQLIHVKLLGDNSILAQPSQGNIVVWRY